MRTMPEVCEFYYRGFRALKRLIAPLTQEEKRAASVTLR